MKLRDCSRCDGSGKEIDPVTTGKEMRRMRLARGVDQCDVAREMGLSKQYICNLERGNRNWTKELIARFTKAINQ